MNYPITIKDLEFENGRLVKVRGMRPQYMGGDRLIQVVMEIAALLATPKPQPTEGGAHEKGMREALDRLIKAIDREPMVGDLDYPHAHNDWRGWRKKILRPAADAARAALNAKPEGSDNG